MGWTTAQIDAEVLNHNFAGGGITGGVLIDEIKAGVNGDVVIRTSGDVREVLVDNSVDILFDHPTYDPGAGADRSRSLDVTAKSFSAVARNKAVNPANMSDVIKASQLEFSSNLSPSNGNLSLGWASALTLTGGTDYELAGYFSGAINLSNFSGTVDVVGVYAAGAITLSANKLRLAGRASAGDDISLVGANGLTLQGDTLVESRTDKDISLSTSAGTLLMNDGAVVKTAGKITLGGSTMTGDIVLGRLQGGAGAISIRTQGLLTDGDTGTTNNLATGPEVPNIIGLGLIDVRADQGIGTSTDRVVIQASTVSSLYSGVKDTFVELRPTVSGSVTLNKLDARHADLLAQSGGLVVGADNWVLSGDLRVKAAGDVTDVGKLIVPGQFSVDAAGQSVLLDNVANDFGVVNLAAATVNLVDANSLTLGGAVTGNLSAKGTALTLNALAVGGNLVLTGNGALTDNGPVTVTGTTSLEAGTGGDIALDGSNDFGGAVSVISARDVVISDNNTLTLSGTVSRNLTATATGALSLGTLTVEGVSRLAGAGITDTGTLTLKGATWLDAGRVIDEVQRMDIQSATAGSFTASIVIDAVTYTTAAIAWNARADQVAAAWQAALSSLSGATVRVESPRSGVFDVTFSGVLSGRNLAAITLATGGLTASTPVVGVSEMTAGRGQAITLDSASNDFVGHVTVVSATYTQLTDANALSVSGSSNQDWTLRSLGTLTLGSSAIGRDLNILGAAGVILGNVTVSGQLQMTSTGDVSAIGTLAVAGASTLTAAGRDIVLNGAANQLQGAISVSARHVNIVDTKDLTFSGAITGDLVLKTSGALTLGTTSVSGTSTLTSVGLMTDVGALTLGSVVSLDAGGYDVKLDAGNDFGAAVHATLVRNLELNDINSLILGDVSASGNLRVSTLGHLTDSGVVKVLGSSVFNAGATGDITLNTSLNDFVGALTVTLARDVTLVDANALDMAASTIGGNLSLTVGELLSDSGALQVTGTSVMQARYIVLDHGSNNFATVRLTTRNATVSDLNGLDLGASTLSGNLVLTTGGAITDSGALSIAGTTSLTVASGNDITLDNANHFAGSLSVSGARDVTLNDTGAVNFGRLQIARDWIVTAAGAISDSAAIEVQGRTDLTIVGAGSTGRDIVLDESANNFVGTVSLSAYAAEIRDKDALTLGTVTLGGDFNVRAQGSLSGAAQVRVTGATVLDTGLVQAEVQRLDVSAATGGTFTASIQIDGVTYTTASLAYNASATLVANAFNTALAALSTASVTVTSASSGIYDIRWGGSLVGRNLPLLVLNTALTGPAVAGVSEVTAGRGESISLNNATNDFLGWVTVLSATDITLSDANTLKFTGAADGGDGDMALTAGLALELGATSSTDSMSLTAGAGGILLGQTQVAGALSLSAAGGAVTQSAGKLLRVGTTASLQAGSVNLDNLNTLHGALTLVSTGNTVLRSTTSMNLSQVTVGGNLSLNTQGGMTDTGVISVVPSLA